MSEDYDDEAMLVTDPGTASSGKRSKTIEFYSLGVGNSPYDFHLIINWRRHHSGSEV